MSDELVGDVIKDESENEGSVPPGFTAINGDEINAAIKLNDSNTKKEILDEQKPLITTGNEGVDNDTLKLYEEFSDFLVQKADIVDNDVIKVTISTGIDVLDAIIGGGFPTGALSMIVGAPGSGKSMLAAQVIANGQKQYKNLIAAFLDSEEATTAQRLYNLGVSHPKIKPITDITVEKVFKMLEAMCLFKDQKKMIDLPSLVVWDSVANTLSQKEREAEDINQVIGYKARLLSILLPKFVAKCSTYNIGWLAVNQLRDEMTIGGPFSAPKDLKFMPTGKNMPGGNALKYNAFTLLAMKVKTIIQPEKYGFEGLITAAKTVKCKLFPPNIEVELVGSYTTGYSNFWTNYHFLTSQKKLHTGAWNYLIELPDIKFRTKDAESIYSTNEDFKKVWDNTVKDTIETEIISKNKI